MKRRDILMALGLAGLGVALGPVRAWAEMVGGRAPLTPRAVIDAMRHPASAARIGRACLAEHGAEGSAADLATLLERSLTAPRPERSRRALRRALGQRMRDDFAAGDTVRVKGWVLSRTEVRLFTLAALETPAV